MASPQPSHMRIRSSVDPSPQVHSPVPIVLCRDGSLPSPPSPPLPSPPLSPSPPFQSSSSGPACRVISSTFCALVVGKSTINRMLLDATVAFFPGFHSHASSHRPTDPPTHRPHISSRLISPFGDANPLRPLTPTLRPGYYRRSVSVSVPLKPPTSLLVFCATCLLCYLSSCYLSSVRSIGSSPLQYDPSLCSQTAPGRMLVRHCAFGSSCSLRSCSCGGFLCIVLRDCAFCR
jgi:hypothetical protein